MWWTVFAFFALGILIGILAAPTAYGLRAKFGRKTAFVEIEGLPFGLNLGKESQGYRVVQVDRSWTEDFMDEQPGALFVLLRRTR
jgi:hypothetical protein